MPNRRYPPGSPEPRCVRTERPRPGEDPAPPAPLSAPPQGRGPTLRRRRGPAEPGADPPDQRLGDERGRPPPTGGTAPAEVSSTGCPWPCSEVSAGSPPRPQ